MLFFAGLVVGREIEELGAVEADALGAVAKGIVDVFGKLDIGLKAHDASVERLGGQIRQRRQLKAHRGKLLPGLDIFRELFGVGTDDDDAAGSIDHDDVAAGHFRSDISEPDDRGNSHCPRDDGGVAGASAGIGGKAADELTVERRGLRGEQVVGDNRHLAGQVEQVFLRCPIRVRRTRFSMS